MFAQRVAFSKGVGGSIYVILACFIVLLQPHVSTVRAEQVDDAVPRDFEKFAIPAWRRLQKSMSSMSGIIEWTAKLHQIAPVAKQIYIHKRTQYFLQQGVAGKIVVKNYDESGRWLPPAIVLCYNPEYAFEAQQNRLNGPFFITLFGKSEQTYRSCKRPIDVRLRWATFPYRGSHYHPPLSDLIASPDCHILQDQGEYLSGLKVIKMRLLFTPKSPAEVFDSLDSSVKEITLVLDPSADWRVLSDTIRSSTIGVRSVKASYVANTQEFGRLSAIEETDYKPNPQISLASDVYKFSSLSFLPIASNEFSTASVGYPNMKPATTSSDELPASNVSEPWRPLSIIIVLIVVSLILFAVYLLKRRERHSH